MTATGVRNACLSQPGTPPPTGNPWGRYACRRRGKGKAEFYCISSWACVPDVEGRKLVHWPEACSMWVKGIKEGSRAGSDQGRASTA